MPVQAVLSQSPSTSIGAITAATIDTGAIDADAIDSTAVVEIVGTVVNSGGGTATLAGALGDVANVSIATRLGRMEGLSYNNSRYLAVTADMTNLVWQTAATHATFGVSGTARLRMWITCGGTLTDTGTNLAVIQFGYTGATAAFIAATNAAGKGGQTITAGQLWYNSTPVAGPEVFADVVMDYIVPDGIDIGYEITGEALTGGSLIFHCVWEPLDALGLVIAGAGGILA